MWIQTIRYKYEKCSHVYSKGAYNIKNADVYIVVTKFDPKMDSWGLISSSRQNYANLKMDFSLYICQHS